MALGTAGRGGNAALVSPSLRSEPLLVQSSEPLIFSSCRTRCGVLGWSAGTTSSRYWKLAAEFLAKNANRSLGLTARRFGDGQHVADYSGHSLTRSRSVALTTL
jgi:hypothetical protein